MFVLLRWYVIAQWRPVQKTWRMEKLTATVPATLSSPVTTTAVEATRRELVNHSCVGRTRNGTPMWTACVNVSVDRLSLSVTARVVTLVHCGMMLINSPSSSLCSHSVLWLGEGLSMLLPHLPILCYPLPNGTLPVVVYFIFPTSHRSSSRSFPFIGFPGGDTH